MDFKMVGLDEVGISGIAAGGLRYLMTAKKRSVLEILVAIATAWIVAMWAHPWVLEVCIKWGFGEKEAIGATGVIAFLAPDLLQGLLNLGKTIREEGILSILSKFRR